MSHSPLLLQLVVIIVTARLCGVLLRYVGQPPVIGEMAGGLLLGPIVLGAWFPEFQAALFARESLPGLGALSTLGLVLFMFIVGVEQRFPDGVRAQMRQAGWVGVFSVALPIGLGLATAPLLHPLAPQGTGFWPFAMFMAAAMSITAFPVLARILKDRQLTSTAIARLALPSAALADVLAWVILAFVVAMNGAHGGYDGFVRTVIGLLVLCVVLFTLVRPAYAWLLRRHSPDGNPSMLLFAVILAGAFTCAGVTQWLGLHEVFGAFLFGVCLPRDDRLMKYLGERLEYIAIAVLMPIFFALAGLSTTKDAFVGTGLGALVVIVLTASVSKILGGAAGARMSGFTWRDSFAVGSLMNARGLLELIVMKVGLDAGIIGPSLFTMLLIMALVTTVMTSPLLSLFAGKGLSQAERAPEPS